MSKEKLMEMHVKLLTYLPIKKVGRGGEENQDRKVTQRLYNLKKTVIRN